MRQPVLMYVRNLVPDAKSIEVALWVCDKAGISWSPFFTDKLNAINTAIQNMQGMTGVFSETGDIPQNFEAASFISTIPDVIPKGFVLPKYSTFLPSTGAELWEAPYDYYFIEGSCTPVVFPEVQATWYLSLQGVLLIGCLLTYRAIDQDWTSTQPDTDDYNGSFVLRNNGSGIDVYTPKNLPSYAWQPYAERQVISRQGFWEVVKTWVYVELLWTYPPIEGSWDMRLLGSQERIELVTGQYSTIVDEIQDYPEGFAWLPSPVSTNTRRIYGVPEYARDEVLCGTWDIPFILKGKVRKATGSVHGSVLPVLIPIALDRLKGLGFGSSVSARPVSITEKILSVNEAMLIVKEGEQEG